MQLTDHQKTELAKATAGNIGLLTGNPGSGKSTTIAAYIRSLLSSNGRGSIAVAAPTGKAARRMTESLRGQGIELNATTIHRLLAYTYVDGHGSFGFNRSNPLPHRHVFIDEWSMGDVGLMSHLMAARKRDTQYIFIGDPNQLPPVGHGAPLRDMIAMRLPHGHLSEVHRNAGQIVRCCKSIVEKQRFVSSESLSISTDCKQCRGRGYTSGIPDDESAEDCIACGGTGEVESENLYVDSDWKKTSDQIQLIQDWLSPSSMLFDCELESVDPIWDCQVIVPLNEKSEVARKPLNKLMQGWLNPDGEQAKGNPFRVGDKIVCSKNGWYLAAPDCPMDEQNDEGRVYCANGEQARVIEISSTSTIAELTLPERRVRVGKSKGDDGDESGRWELAYAISAHKSQGAEWKYVIVIGDESGASRWLCDRHWLLTAISRGQRACVCIAKPNTLQDWCRKTHLMKRRTFAVEKYHELLVAK